MYKRILSSISFSHKIIESEEHCIRNGLHSWILSFQAFSCPVLFANHRAGVSPQTSFIQTTSRDNEFGWDLKSLLLKYSRIKLWNCIWRYPGGVKASEAALTAGRRVPWRGVKPSYWAAGSASCSSRFLCALNEWRGGGKWIPETNVMTSGKCEHLREMKFKQTIKNQWTNVRKIISKNTH